MAFKIIRSDIAKVSADAIVNNAETKPVSEGGTGHAVYTEAVGINAKYIINTVWPEWSGGEKGEREAVGNCYKNSLKLAKELGCESIAFPLAAADGVPAEEELKTAVTVFEDFLNGNEMQITLAVSGGVSFALSGGIFSGLAAFIEENCISEKAHAMFNAAEAMPMESGTAPYEGGSKRKSRPQLFGMAAMPGRVKGCGAARESSEAVSADEDREVSSGGRTLEDLMANIGESWQESLFRLIDEKGFSDTEVYKRANVDRKLFSKIRSNPQYQPKKITAVAFALALRLNIDETKDLLGRAGYALSPGSRFDLIIEYFIEHEVYDTYTINLALFEHRQPLLGE